MRDADGLLVFPAPWPFHRRMQRGREPPAEAIVQRLLGAQLLERRRTRDALPLLRQQLLTQGFFWIPAAIVAAPEKHPAERLDLHLESILAPFARAARPAGAGSSSACSRDAAELRPGPPSQGRLAGVCPGGTGSGVVRPGLAAPPPPPEEEHP